MEECYYCEKNQAENERFWYSHELFYVVKRTFPTGMKFKSEKVKIPRCRSCKRIHNKIMLVTMIIGVIIFGISAFFFHKFSDSNLLTVIILSVITSFFVTGIIHLIYNDFFTKSTFNTKAEEDIESFPLVYKMINEGWVLSKPDPSVPSTAAENKEFQERVRQTTKKTEGNL